LANSADRLFNKNLASLTIIPTLVENYGFSKSIAKMFAPKSQYSQMIAKMFAPKSQLWRMSARHFRKVFHKFDMDVIYRLYQSFPTSYQTS